MTISTLFATITSEIANLSITGVTIKDYDELVPSWVAIPNVLYPDIDAPFLTNFAPNFQSFRRGANALVDFSYTLNYRFLGTQVGQGNSLFTGYPDMVNKVLLIINAVVTNHSYASGKANIELGPVTLGNREDPAGNQYHGADIALNVTEMQNT
jgi:hypothetical protein